MKQISTGLATLVMAGISLCTVSTEGQSSGSTFAISAQSSATGQASGITGSVPSGSASSEVLHLTLRDAVTQALRFNLASIETGENARIARGQRLLALSKLLPQISAGASENVQQLSLATLGIKSLPGIPTVIGPFGYSSVDATVSQTLFSFESIQRFRSARTAEQAAQLYYNDVLDVVTLVVGNAYLQVIQAGSHIEAQEAQVSNAKPLFDQARDRSRLVRHRALISRALKFNCTPRNTSSVFLAIILRSQSSLWDAPSDCRSDSNSSSPTSFLIRTLIPPPSTNALLHAYRTRSDFRAALERKKPLPRVLRPPRPNVIP